MSSPSTGVPLITDSANTAQNTTGTSLGQPLIPPPHPTKRKVSTESQTNALAPETEQRVPKATKQHEVSEYFALPFSISERHSLHKAHTSAKTPPRYEHGPRKGFGHGPLIGYPEHAAILTGKLEELAEDMANAGVESAKVEDDCPDKTNVRRGDEGERKR